MPSASVSAKKCNFREAGQRQFIVNNPGQTIYVWLPSDGNLTKSVFESPGIVSTGDAEDHAILVPLSVAQTLSGHPGQFRQLFVSALTKPADSLSDRDPKSLTPTEYDRWFCSPYISSISYQIGQVLPGTDIRAIRRVADRKAKFSRASALCSGSSRLPRSSPPPGRCRYFRNLRASAPRGNRHHESDRRHEWFWSAAFFLQNSLC